VRGVRELPLFPPPVVLFPGMPSLCISSIAPTATTVGRSRGRQLFGLSYFDSDASGKEIPPAGHIGCVAEIYRDASPAGWTFDVIDGGCGSLSGRCVCRRGDPYLVVRVNYFEAEEEDSAALANNARDVATMFMRVAIRFGHQ